MKLLILPALLISSSLFAQETHVDHAVAIPGSHPKAIVRPLLHEKPNFLDVPMDMSDFLNNLSATCPNGMVLDDAKHLMHSNMSYIDTFNAVAQLECIPHTKSSK